MIKLNYQSTTLALATVFVVSTVLAVMFNNSAYAVGGACESNHDDLSKPCMEANRAKTTLSPQDFTNAVKSCEGRDSLGFTTFDIDTQTGNCSNAIASCFQTLINTEGCTNDSVLAAAVEKDNKGNLSESDWTSAIDRSNAKTSGKDYMSNTGVYKQRTKDLNTAAENTCKSQKNTSDYDNCVKNINAAVAKCYSDGGGQNANISDASLQSCIRNSSNNEQQCSVVGGVWNGSPQIQGPGVNQAPKCGASPTPGATPGNAYCEQTFGGGDQKLVDACNAGFNKEDCSSLGDEKYQSVCRGVYASQVCDKGTALEKFKCTSAVSNCLQQFPNNVQGQTECLQKIPDINQAQINSIINSMQAGDAGKCGRARTNLITCGGTGVGAIGSILKIVLVILSVLVGIAAVGGIVYGAILYASASDNSGQVSKAKEIVRNVVIGLVLYVFMVAILNWLVPGGAFSG